MTNNNPSLIKKIIEIINNNRLFAIIVFIIISITALLLLWPKINVGTISITTNNYPITITYCETSSNNNTQNETGCDPTAITTLNISDSKYTLSLTPGTYYLSATKQNYQRYEQNFEIKIGQNTPIKIDLQPLGITITDQLIHDFSFDPTSNSIYYLSEDLITDQNNQTKTQFSISKKTGEQSQELFKTTILTEIEKSFWSPDHQKLIINAREENKDFRRYFINLTDQSMIETKLPNLNILWSKDSNKVYYLYIDQKQNPDEKAPDKIPTGGGFIPTTIYGPNNNAITIANPDGSDWQVLHKLDDNIYDLVLSKSDDDNYFAVTTANYEGFIINNQNNNISKLNADILFRKISFSPNNKYILAETINDIYRPSLQYSSLENINFKPLDILTFIEKTNWISNNEIIVAIPDGIPTTTFDDLLNTTDRIKLITLSNENFNISEWNIVNQISEGASKISANSDSLYLLDKYNYLYFIPKTK